MIEKRPWGTYQIIYQDEDCIIKRIVIDPEQKFSLQYHGYRDEMWTCIKGHIMTEINGERQIISYGESIFINKGQAHRAHNMTKDPVVFIEVQTGDVLDEEDIIRLDDDYGRA